MSLNILLVLDNLTAYKINIYNSLRHALKETAVVDVKIYDCDPVIFKNIIDENLGRYNHYVIVPNFFYDAPSHSYTSVLNRIPSEQVLVLDKKMPEIGLMHKAIYQDFENDTFFALESVLDLLEHYKKLVLVFSGEGNYPLQIIDGITRFSDCYSKSLKVINSVKKHVVEPGSVYIVIEEGELYNLVKNVRASSLRIGHDIGIISFNDTILEELLDITVFSTDFQQMGLMAAGILFQQEYLRIRNAFRVIRRSSLAV